MIFIKYSWILIKKSRFKAQFHHFRDIYRILMTITSVIRDLSYFKNHVYLPSNLIKMTVYRK